mgnify:CR=1 FL=1
MAVIIYNLLFFENVRFFFLGHNDPRLIEFKQTAYTVNYGTFFFLVIPVCSGFRKKQDHFLIRSARDNCIINPTHTTMVIIARKSILPGDILRSLLDRIYTQHGLQMGSFADGTIAKAGWGIIVVSSIR